MDLGASAPLSLIAYNPVGPSQAFYVIGQGAAGSHDRSVGLVPAWDCFPPVSSYYTARNIGADVCQRGVCKLVA